MKRYRKIVWQFLAITIALYIVRPCEALYKAVKYSLKMFGRCFVHEFKSVYSTEGWDSPTLYKSAIEIFRKNK